MLTIILLVCRKTESEGAAEAELMAANAARMKQKPTAEGFLMCEIFPIL